MSAVTMETLRKGQMDVSQSSCPSIAAQCVSFSSLSVVATVTKWAGLCSCSSNVNLNSGGSFGPGSAGERCGLDPETEAPEQNTVNM